MRALTAIAAVALIVAIAGCSASGGGGSSSVTFSTESGATIPSTTLVGLLQRYTKSRGLAAQSISCPPTITEKTRGVINCVASYKGGGTGRFTATQTDNHGDVHVEPAEMIAPEIEDDIATHAKPPGSITATCPAHVPIVVGKTFKCTGRTGPQRHTFIVRIIDKHAGFNFRETS
jgi:hypothetical protein